MKKRILAILLAAILTLSFSGCKTGFTMNASELMRPPKATGSNAEIQELIDKHAGEGYTLKYPQNGNYRTAITTVDFDCDDKEEAIAFYQPAGEAQSVHLLIMKEIDGNWSVLGDHASTSTMVDRLLFADLDGDSCKEIVVGFSSYNSLINSMSIYLVEGNKSTELVTDYTYTEALVGNFTETKAEEIMLLSIYTPENPASAKLITLNDTKNNLYTIAEASMDDSITSFSQLLTGNDYDGQFGLVIDGVTANTSNTDTTYKTQILYYDNDYELLQRVIFTKSEPTNQESRTYAFMSQDIDKDGILEIPNTFKLSLGEGMMDVVPAPIVYWCEYTPYGSMIVKEETIASIVYNFYFFVPDRWENNFTAYANYSTNEVTICEWDDKRGLVQELLTLKMFTPELWNDGSSSKGYTQLAVSDTYIYGFKIPQSNSPLMLTNEEIAKAFVITEK